MNNVVQFPRPKVSIEVIKNLIKLGYLKRTQCNNPSAVTKGLARLQADLHRPQSSARMIRALSLKLAAAYSAGSRRRTLRAAIRVG